MTCRYCEGVGVRREMIAEGFESIRDAPRCAFARSEDFQDDNWDCGTMNRLRDSITTGRDGSTWSEDQYLGVLPYDGQFIVLGWYKSRGRTEFATIVDQYNTRVLKQGDAYAVIDGKVG